MTSTAADSRQLHLRTLTGEEVRLGVAGGRFVPPADDGPVQDLRHFSATAGLADCHAHIGADSIGETTASTDDVRTMMERNVRAQLVGGVLLVADKGSRDPATLEALTWEPDRRPELHMAGRMLAAPGGYYNDYALEVNGADLPNAVAAACSGGATWVKLVGDWPRRGFGAIPNYAEDELRAAVAIAHAAGCRVAIHTAAPETPSLAVAAGVDSIEHGLFLTAHDISELGARGGAWVPTVLAMAGLADQLREGSSGRRLINDGLANVRRLLPGAPAAGVVVLAGTDLHVPHGRVAEEVVALHGAGLAISEALDAAISAPASYLGSARGLHPGAPADLVAFSEDPLADLSTLLHPRYIMRCGNLILEDS
jgi:imidazolonepropionase-like amidohydrolase